MSLRTAVIPAAGLGTRMMPAAKAVPKEMLPVVDRPAIQYVVEEAAAAGVRDMILITSRDKRAIERHFRPDLALDARLRGAGRENLLGPLNRLLTRRRFHFVRQREQRGLGDAVAQAQRLVGTGAFLCLLGDAIFSGTPLPARQLVDAYRLLGTTVIGLEEVAADRVDRYGMAAGRVVGDGIIRIDELVEKPKRGTARSRLAIAARYVLTADIFECLRLTRPGKGGEIQLTDGLRILLKRRPVHGVILKARRHDIGNTQDWLAANVYFAGTT